MWPWPGTLIFNRLLEVKIHVRASFIKLSAAFMSYQKTRLLLKAIGLLPSLPRAVKIRTCQHEQFLCLFLRPPDEQNADRICDRSLYGPRILGVCIWHSAALTNAETIMLPPPSSQLTRSHVFLLMGCRRTDNGEWTINKYSDWWFSNTRAFCSSKSNDR